MTDLTVRDKHQRIGGFQKEKRRLAAGKAHFLRVFFVIAPHAIDAVDRKQARFAMDWDSDGRRRREYCIHRKSIAIK
jgi:hypothetical protein